MYLCLCSHKCFKVNLYITGGRAYRNAYFGAGSGPIFLDDVQCTSSSNQLLACPSRPILFHNCLHSSDAGVACESKLLYKSLYSQCSLLTITFIQFLAQLVS